jgi:indolepyruvate ferredoxin oxidoreductase
MEQEELLHRHRLYAALAFARANQLDRTWIDPPRARLGILTTGKAALDVRQALTDLGIDDAHAESLGIRLRKVAMPWPLEKSGIESFARGLDEILVVEEKRGVMENQLKEQLYHASGARPRVVGKFDEQGEWLLPSMGDLSPGLVARAIAKRLLPHQRSERVEARLAAIEAGERARAAAATAPARTPLFCSGCPHNVSTKVPEGSRAEAGIGCHYMARWLDRRTDLVSQMGGEGVHWIGQAPFTDEEHVFANLGDGTYHHSGSLAIRAAVSAGVRITYKILFNDAVAMTGGQAVDGTLTVPQLTRQLADEGVTRIAVVTAEAHRYPRDAEFAPGVTFHRREALDALQRELREHPGVSVLVYDQTCAAELRRRRKRGLAEDPPRRVFINDAVCEGCGDCSDQSSCVSIEPLETEFGTKRRINHSSCNKDESCLNGLCPSFVTVTGGRLRRAPARHAELRRTQATLPRPSLPEPDAPWNVVVTGVGGTGVVTIGALLGMAAHLEGKHATVLDMTGLAQKGGAVISHVRLAPGDRTIHTPRVPLGSADLLLAADLLVAAGQDAVGRIDPARTRSVINTHLSPTAEFVLSGSSRLELTELLARVHDRSAGIETLDATGAAAALLGDAVATNLFLVGFAWQQGWLPLELESIERAVELNGVAVESNRQALAWGRLAAADPQRLARLVGSAAPPAGEPISRSLDERIERRASHLVAYQGEGLAARYRALVERVRAAEQAAAPGRSELAEAVARGYHRVLAPKDEYEVARLHTSPGFRQKLAAWVEGDVKVHLHLAPPLFARVDPETGRPRKRAYGPWLRPVLALLARLRFLRGTPLDPFRYTEERRMERALLGEYEATVEKLLAGLTAANQGLAARIASLPEEIRGFGAIKLARREQARAEERRLLDRFLKHEHLPVLEDADPMPGQS